MRDQVAGGQLTKTAAALPHAQWRVEIRDPERAIEAFRNDRGAALEAIAAAVQRAAADALNKLLDAEMEFFLRKKAQANNCRDGHTMRHYWVKGVGRLRLRIPRDRDGAFSSAVIPEQESLDPRSREDLVRLHLAGLPSETVASVAKVVLGVEVSRQTVERCGEQLVTSAAAWLQRTLAEPLWGVYVAEMGINPRLDGTGGERRLYVVGVDGSNHLCVVSVEDGHRDSVRDWRAVFGKLKRRGLRADALRIGVLAGPPELRRAFCSEFPEAEVAACWRYTLRATRSQVPPGLHPTYDKLTKKMMYAASKGATYDAFSGLRLALEQEAPQAVAELDEKLEALVAHYAFDRAVWAALKTTNATHYLHVELAQAAARAGEDCDPKVSVALAAARVNAVWKRQRINSRSVTKPLSLRRTVTTETATEEGMEALLSAQRASVGPRRRPA